MSPYNVMVVQQIYVFQGQKLLIKACSLWQCKHKQATDPNAMGKPAVKCSFTDNHDAFMIATSLRSLAICPNWAACSVISLIPLWKDDQFGHPSQLCRSHKFHLRSA